MLTLKVTVTGHDEADLTVALQEVTRLVGESYASGQNENDTGSYRFELEGEREPVHGICPSCQMAGSHPVVLRHSADAYCNACGADWPTDEEAEQEEV